MISRVFCAGVTETVVPGHTRISPPRVKCRIAVSEPAVTEDPARIRLPASTMAPGPPVTGTASGVATVVSVETDEGGWNGDVLPTRAPSAGFRRIIRRLPAAAQGWPTGARIPGSEWRAPPAVWTESLEQARPVPARCAYFLRLLLEPKSANWSPRQTAKPAAQDR